MKTFLSGVVGVFIGVIAGTALSLDRCANGDEEWVNAMLKPWKKEETTKTEE